MRRSVAVVVVAVLLVCVTMTSGGDRWPQFRGPTGQGHADDVGLPLVWGEGTNIAWKTRLEGRGWSSPVIADGRIWMTTADEQGHSLRAVCVDQQTGSLLHNVEVFRLAQPESINPKNSYASPTAVLDDEGRVYVYFGTWGAACLQADSGAVVWRNRELRLEHKEGPGSSPILWGELLIFHCDGLDVQFVAALDRRSGRLVWKRDRLGAKDPNPDFRKAYSTPLVIEAAGREEMISVGADHTTAYDPATGEELWVVDYKGFSNVARPVHANGLVYISTSFARPALWAVRPGGRGNVTATHVAWKTDRQVSASASPLVVGERLYMVSNRGVATCRDAQTGREVWVERLGGNYSASPVYADGRIHFFSEEGKTTVIAAADRFEPLAENQLEGVIMASPAVARRALFLRTDTHLYRIEDGAAFGAAP